MPQVPKSEEQRKLESRISRTQSLLSAMRNQLASVRKRNKADREKARRAEKVDALDEKQEEAFQILMNEVMVERTKRGARTAGSILGEKKKESKLPMIDEEFEQQMNALLGGEQDPSAGSSKDRV